MSRLQGDLPRRAHPGFIARPALVQAVAAGQARGLTVLAAPAGYGKTWLAGQVARRWSQGAPRRDGLCVWTLQGSTTILQALRSFCALFDEQDVPASLDTTDAIDTALAAMTARGASPDTMVIDIDGVAPSKAVQALIAQIVLELAPRARLLVAGRTPWLLPLDRLAMLTPLKVLRAAELAMNAQEIALAQDLDPQGANDWLQLTEGWPVVCGGAAHWRAPRAASAQEALPDRLVALYADYLEHELLAPLAPRDVRLLMQVSVFDAIEPGLLEAVEPGTPWSRLASLVDSGLPLSDARTDWDHIVLHPVFRRFLRRRIQARAPLQHQALHRRAAHYFAATGHFRDAMQHAAQTGDTAFQAQLTESSGGWRISLREGLDALSPAPTSTAELAARFPRAALARIYWQAQTGRIDEARLALDRLSAPGPVPALRNDLLGVRAVIAIYRDEDFDPDDVQRLAEMRPDGGEDEPLLFPGGATLQAAMLNNAGLHERAAQAARAAIVEAEAQGSRYVEFYGQLQHALALHGLGRVGSVVPGYFRARELAQDIFGEGSGECRLIGLLIAHAAWLAGHDDQAERAAADLHGLYRLHAWFDPYARVLEVAQALGRARDGQALEDRVLEDFEELSNRRALPRLAALVSLGRARQAFEQGRMQVAIAHCEAAREGLVATGRYSGPALARALAPIWLERARIALAGGEFDTADTALAALRDCRARSTDGAVSLGADLLEAYVALRARRYREAMQGLARAVHAAESSGLRRSFLANAALVGELVRYARDHALTVEARVLARAAEFAGGEASAIAAQDRRGAGPSGGLLLTGRETDILHCLAEGLSSKEMARRLTITEATVKTHRKHLYEKLNASLRSQAIVRARELGLL